MVHIPVFNVDVPEPRVAELLPGAADVSISLIRRIIENVERVVHPTTREEDEELMKTLKDGLPREYQRVLNRYDEDKIKNDDQLSSELEDASYDHYRRLLRTGVAGATEEMQEDVSAWKLGLDRPSVQEGIWDMYREANELMHEDAASMLQVPDHLRPLYNQAISQQAVQQDLALALQTSQLVNTSAKVNTALQQSAHTILSAGWGIALSLMVFKGTAALLQRLIKGKKSKKAPVAKQGLVSRQQKASTSSLVDSASGQGKPQQLGMGSAQKEPASNKGAAPASARSRATARKR